MKKVHLQSLTLEEKVEKLTELVEDLLCNDYGSQQDKEATYALLEAVKEDIQQIRRIIVRDSDDRKLDREEFFAIYRGVHIRRWEVQEGEKKVLYFGFYAPSAGWLRDFTTSAEVRREIDRRLLAGEKLSKRKN